MKTANAIFALASLMGFICVRAQTEPNTNGNRLQFLNAAPTGSTPIYNAGSGAAGGTAPNYYSFGTPEDVLGRGGNYQNGVPVPEVSPPLGTSAGLKWGPDLKLYYALAARSQSGAVAGIPPQYSTGAHIHLEAALVALVNAGQELKQATAFDKAEYLPRAIEGTNQAMADVMLAMDLVEGRTTPAQSALPSLPSGVGNASSGILVIPTVKPQISSPHMEAAVMALTIVQNELKLVNPTANKGIFLPRAIADAAFAIDNANAAINLVNGLPVEGTKPTPPPSLPAVPSPFDNPKVLWGSVVALVIVMAFIAELFIRRRQGA